MSMIKVKTCFEELIRYDFHGNLLCMVLSEMKLHELAIMNIMGFSLTSAQTQINRCHGIVGVKDIAQNTLL